ncbi:MAG: daunorubicin ABC transporter ATP-binding protein, partial [Ilumatobacteraceae bacterium]
MALYDIIRELNAEGQTVLLTPHYMEEADSLCERLAIIDHGKILALGTPAELKRMVGAHTIVTVMANGDLDQLAVVLRDKVEGVHEAKQIGSERDA